MPYADPFKNRECVKRYKLEHREEINARTRERAKHPDAKRRAKLSHDKTKAKNPEKYRLMRAREYQKRKTKAKAWEALDRLRNPDRARDRVRRRRALKRKVSVGDAGQIIAWEKAWRSLRLVQCKWCDILFPPKLAHVDHIVPLIRGGAHELSNLAISCRRCNLTKNDKPIDLWLKLIGRLFA